ncbi:MAG: tRNA (adenosine(37)-N6)-threonylcarbamoyltransferase complex transferase subunit TsaD [Myxococcota bacterium]
MARILAIETSCDETAAAVVDDTRRVLSNVVATQIPVHARYGGVVPELASRSHLTAIGTIIERALEEAGFGMDAVDAVAVTTGPGLAGCLLVGLQTAKGLAWSRGLPLIPVDHIEAHVRAIHLVDDRGAGADAPSGPYVALAVSGGHTSLGRIAGPGEVTLLGQTLDDAAGEAFDKVAKMIGLPYPGGVHIDRLARQGDREAVDLPRPMLHKGLDFSFSGLKTAVRYHVERQGGAEALSEQDVADLAASVQEAIVDVLVTKSRRACAEEGLRDLVIAGGVACNSRLRERITAGAAGAGLRAHLTPARYCTDNAAMIGGLGAELLARGEAMVGGDLASADIHVTRRPARSRGRGRRRQA